MRDCYRRESGLGDFKHYNSWVEINLDYLSDNIRNIKSLLSPDCEVMAVVKSNAYGHGAIAISKYIEKMYPTAQLAVADAWEGLELRKAGIKLPILVLGPISDDQLEEAVYNDLSITLFNIGNAKLVSDISIRLNKTSKVHIKIDSGLRRIGFKPGEELKRAIDILKNLTGLDIIGVYTHFAESGALDKTFTKGQLEIFNKGLNQLRENNIDPKFVHSASTQAILELPGSHFNLVRAGKAIYGYHGMDHGYDKISLKPILEWKAVITNINQLLPGESIGYARTFTASKKMSIAVVPVGFGDGYSSLLSNRGSVIINGKKVPIVGRVCMDSCFVDITGLENVKIGDIATILGEDNGEKIDKFDICKITGAQVSEVLAIIGRRVARIYKSKGEYVSADSL